MDDHKLGAILDSEISQSMGFIGGELSEQRRKAMKYYLGEPFGNEKAGRSQVVMTDVADTIEWVLPSLMRIFASKSDAVVFEPTGPEDEQAAEQESDYLNHVFYTENNGFLLLYSWFKDALLSKTGVLKAWWDDTPEKTRERYKGLDDAQLAELLNDPNVEPVEHEETPYGRDVTVIHTAQGGKLRMAVVPPEEFLISREATSLVPGDARFVAHRVRRTISDLREAGYSKKILEHLPSDEGWSFNEETSERRHLDDERPEFQMSALDDSQRQVWVYECYLKVDYDGDGIAELRKVTRVGKEILDNELVDSVPFYALTPIPLTHKFHGLSLADVLMDLQLIKSVLVRQMLDNLYLTNNPEREVVSAQVNMEDLMTSRPGGLKRVKTPGMIRDLNIPFTAGASFPMLEYLDQVRKQRTGVGSDVSGLDKNTLANANTGVVAQSYDAAQMRIELIARIFAETGVRSLFLGIHELLLKHQDKQKVIKLRNQWTPVDPTEWRHRANMTINVGLGTGNRDQQMMHLERIIQHQATLAQNGGMGVLVTPSNIYNALSRTVENAGLKEPGLYFTDPSSVEPTSQEEEQPDAQILAIQVQAQIEQAKLALEEKKLELESAKAGADADHKTAALDAQRHTSELRSEIDVLSQQVKIYIEQSKQQPAAVGEALPEIDEAVESTMGSGPAPLAQEQQSGSDMSQVTELLAQSQLKIYDTVGRVAAQLTDIASQVAALTAAAGESTGPQSVERDSEGRIVRVGKRVVKRDASGAVEGIE